jgi:hypothetical protein
MTVLIDCLIRWEKRLEQFFRDTTANGTPVLLFWLLPSGMPSPAKRACGMQALITAPSLLLPSGRFLLWMLAMVCLANLVTTVPPLPLHFELYDLGLILYLAGIIKGELTEMHGDVRTYGDLRRCERAQHGASPLPAPTPHVPTPKRARCACKCSARRATLPGRYLTDAFNVLDMLLVILLGTLITARHVHVIDPTLPFAYAELPAQVMATDGY